MCYSSFASWICVAINIGMSGGSFCFIFTNTLQVPKWAASVYFWNFGAEVSSSFGILSDNKFRPLHLTRYMFVGLFASNTVSSVRMADHGGFKFITYVLTILWHIYSGLINMRSLYILPHIQSLQNNS